MSEEEIPNTDVGIPADRIERVEAVLAGLMGYALNCGRLDEMMATGGDSEEMQKFTVSFVADLCMYVIGCSPDGDTDPVEIMGRGVAEYSDYVNELYEFAMLAQGFSETWDPDAHPSYESDGDAL